MNGEIRIADIHIGARHRQEMGDIGGLADNIRDIGLLHPIVITPSNRLIAGARRIEAFKRLERETIPTTIIDIEAVVRGERSENCLRLDFTPSEAVAVWKAVEEEERAKAKERQGTRADIGETFTDVGRAKDKAARGTGRSGRTMEKAAAIVEAAEAEPEKFGKLQADMDRTGRVDGPFRRLKVARQAAAIKAEPPPLPRGPFRVIVADPPWPYELRKADPSHRATHPYPQMSIEQIKALDVGGIANEDSILWLWTTNHHMREAFEVLDAWGFRHKTILTWVKNRMGTGDWLRGQSEHCLLAVRGSPIVTLTNQTTVLTGPLRANSQKPDEFYAFVESLCPAPENGYCELFQRTPRTGWIGHGDEVATAS